MISSLNSFDKITAAGILARAALALEDEHNPAAAPALPEERRVREEIIAAARKSAGIAAEDESPETRARLGDFLDVERDNLLGSADTDRALWRLSAKGELPSDLYVVQINPSIANFFGRKFADEKKLIEQSIRSPDREQHYGAPEGAGNPFLISLFAKTFVDKFPARSFTMLVVGERRGLIFTVHQAWHLYPDKVDLRGTADLIDMLRRFANEFGIDIEMGGERGRFIMFAEIPEGVKVPDTVKFTGPNQRKQRTFTLSYFRQDRPASGTRRAALAVCLDLDRYREMLKSYGW